MCADGSNPELLGGRSASPLGAVPVAVMGRWLLTAATVVLALPFGWGLGLLLAYLIAGKNFGQLPAATVPLGLIAAIAFALWPRFKGGTRFTVMLVGAAVFSFFAWLIG